MAAEKFSIKNRIRSFKYAYQGLKVLIKEEHNARIHLFVMAVVVLLGFLLGLSSVEWIAMVIVIGFVLALELVNSSIERLCNFISPGKHEEIKKIKDMMAGAVLLAAVASVVVGSIIFIPKLWLLLLSLI